MHRTLTLDDALFVVRRMRVEDRRCLQAVLPDATDDSFAIDRFNTDGPAWTMCNADCVPVAIAGIAFQTRWSGTIWMVATDGIDRYSFGKLIRLARTVLGQITDPSHPAYKQRIEANVLAGWTGASRFIRHLGFEYEGTRRSAGVGGEDIEMWSIVRIEK
jgi:hypothetical protein